jgi:hypothetical protein
VARSAAEREHALRLYSEHGLAHASEATGVPKATLLRWVDQSGTERNAKKLRAIVLETAQATMAERRARLAERLLTVAEQRVELLADDPTADRRHLAVVAAIAIEKSQLLAGEATVRTEAIQPEQARSELADLQRHWRERRLTA